MSHFDCDGCGACCRTFPIFASAADAGREPRVRAEARRLDPSLATPGWEYRLFPLPFHEACCFLDDANRCTVYATRPDVCRAFAAGSDQCQEARARCGLPKLEPTRTEGRRTDRPG
jgi:Fe-S-cluster containining protein